MNVSRTLVTGLVFLCGWAASVRAQDAQLANELALLRRSGCPGAPGTSAPLRPSRSLDEAARRIALGEPALEAARHAGFRATRVFEATVRGPTSGAQVADVMARDCKAVVEPALTEFGVHREGRTWWVVLAAPFVAPAPGDATAVASRVLALTNEARAQRRQCGGRWFTPAPPVRYEPLLERAARRHAQEMAQFSYLEHRGRDGSDPGDRADRAGYSWRTVGENIAAGQGSAEAVVADWLRSPPHCTTLMNPQFTDMGVAFAADSQSEGGVYWTQAFGARR